MSANLATALLSVLVIGCAGCSAAPSETSPAATSTAVLTNKWTPRLVAVATSPVSAELHWNELTPDVFSSGWEVQRDGERVARLDPDVTQWSDSGLIPGTTYVYVLLVTSIADRTYPTATTVVQVPPAPFFEPFTTTEERRTIEVHQMNLAHDRGSAGGVIETDGATAGFVSLALPPTGSVGVRVSFRPAASTSTGYSVVRLQGRLHGIGSVFLSSTGKLGVRDDAAAVNVVSDLEYVVGIWNVLTIVLRRTSTSVDAVITLNGAQMEIGGAVFEGLEEMAVTEIEFGDSNDIASIAFDDLAVWTPMEDGGV